jgi:hypothetical protein
MSMAVRAAAARQGIGRRSGRVEPRIAAGDPLGERDRAGHEDVLCDRSGRENALGRLLQPGDVRRTSVEIAELVLEQCSHRKGTRVSRLSARADIAHLAGGLPIAFVDGQPCVIESGRGKRPPVAEPLRESERRDGVGTDLLPLA